MNPIHTIRRLACMLTGLAAALAAAVIGAPAAFAISYPPPGPPYRPMTHAVNGVTSGPTGWQIALIAAGEALAAIMAVLAYRARTARHKPVTTAA